MWPETSSDKHFCFFSLFSTKPRCAHWISLSACLPLSCHGDRRGHLDECVPLWDMCSDLSLEAKRLNTQSARSGAKPLWNPELNKSPAESMDVNRGHVYRQSWCLGRSDICLEGDIKPPLIIHAPPNVSFLSVFPQKLILMAGWRWLFKLWQRRSFPGLILDPSVNGSGDWLIDMLESWAGEWCE